MIYIHNRKKSQQQPNQRPYDLPIPLTERGVYQAERNDSDSIWKLMNWCSEQPIDYIKYVCRYCGKKCDNECSKTNTNGEFTRNTFPSEDDKVKQKLSETKDQTEFANTKKSVSFKEPEKEQTKKEVRKAGRSKVVEKELSENQRQKLEEEAKSREKYQRQCYSINKYLQTLKPYTRTMPNSAIKLLYEKPCLQSYGRKNTRGSGGVVYGDYLKTHNVQPHRHGNSPKKYQSFRGALNFGKRTKFDPEERWKKIHRQMNAKLDLKQLASDFSLGFVPVDDGNLESTLKGSINKLTGELFPRSKSANSLTTVSRKNEKTDFQTTKATDLDDTLQTKGKRSRSFGKKEYLFLYKYQNKEGEVQYAKDRHGITCYVDPTFEENKQAYTKFLKKVGPIQAEDVREQDKNIDKIMIANYLKSKEEDLPKHYLMPNCDEPYRPQKFSIKGRKRASTMATDSEK